MPREFSRHQRLAAELMRTLSDVLRFEIKDPGVAGVSLTKVDLSRDLSVAVVYFSLLQPDDDPQPAIDGLRRAAGFLRSKLGQAMKIRHVPELRFKHDDSMAHADRISRLIDAANRTGSEG
ncbi:MAG: 30S ribosome-binding factor RbfA [Gammaproteobacteria bacterium]|nr:30S ribosome-binding factor RbfA [Gammaproteobacteria bacterium]MDH4315573.1 30S ribosome-binding factor RbfA [Gammaproteobacteria bacterium]MDH5215044.1 30S ribosome-binding factor RbfA [Gammaproteobacteria bacterium]MDH5500939.1 30S ribosome-binding factor RbfA [Gammaproteobacteria bacterium]